MATLTVRWYAQLKEIRGQAEEEVIFEPGESLHQIYRRLLAGAPQGQSPTPPPEVAFACNHQVCPAEHCPDDKDLVVFLPPLGGG